MPNDPDADPNHPQDNSHPEDPKQKDPSAEIHASEGPNQNSPVPPAANMEQKNLEAPFPTDAQPEPGTERPESDQSVAGKTWLGRLLAGRTDPGDATRGEVMLYAFGNIENAIANQFFNVLKTVMVVAMHVNPLIIGMILGIKTIWDAVTDPIMAHVTDNTKSRWGRRRPYILVGGVSRIAILLLIVAFMPSGGHLTDNPVMEAQKFANEGIKDAGDARRTAVQSYEQLPTARPAVREKIIEMLPDTLEKVYKPGLAEKMDKRDAYDRITSSLPVLEQDVIDREAELVERQELVDELREQYSGSPDVLEEKLRGPQGMLASAEEKAQKAEELLVKTTKGRRDAIAARFVLEYLIAKTGGEEVTEQQYQEKANAAYAEAGLEPVENIFTFEKKSAPKPTAKGGLIVSVSNWISFLLNPDDPFNQARSSINKIAKKTKMLHADAVEAFEDYDDADERGREKIAQEMAEIRAEADGYVAELNDSIAKLRPVLADKEAATETERQEVKGLEEAAAQRGGEISKQLAQQEKALLENEKIVREMQMLEDRADTAKGQALAAQLVTRQFQENPGQEMGEIDREQAQERAEAVFADAGLTEPYPQIFDKPTVAKGWFAGIAQGFAAYSDPKNSEQRPLVLYVMIALLIFTTLTTVQSVPYYALGIELSPSYNGRTQVVTYRSIMDKFAGLIAPWVPVFCFSLWFTNALDGLFWVAFFACLIGIPSTVLMCVFTKERTHISAKKKKNKLLTNHAGKGSGVLKGFGYALDLFSTMWEVGKNGHFLKIFALYWFIGLTNGVFQQIGLYLNIYWVMGSALSGAQLGAWLSMLAWGLGFLSLPLINWGCRKFQKHRVLGFAIVWMAIGTALKWWAMNPEHPEYQFILPFFFSVGIGSVYTVLPTMMADVTDMDELQHGVRREGMFGAVMAFLMKMVGTFTPILAGIVLVMSGFDPALEYEQPDEVIFRMRLMYSLVPAGMLFFALAILWRYPLTRDRVNQVKAELKKRHQAEDARKEAEQDKGQSGNEAGGGANA